MKKKMKKKNSIWIIKLSFAVTPLLIIMALSKTKKKEKSEKKKMKKEKSSRIIKFPFAVTPLLVIKAYTKKKKKTQKSETKKYFFFHYIGITLPFYKANPPQYTALDFHSSFKKKKKKTVSSTKTPPPTFSR